MKKLFSLVAVVICTILLCIPTLTEENDGEVIEEAFFIGASGVHLDNLKSVLPDLHLTVTSPGWESRDGLEQLRTIAKPTLSALGTKHEDIEEFLARIDEYESNVPFDSKKDVSMFFGIVGKSLLMNFTHTEMMRRGGDILYDAYSLIYSESHPESLSGYRDCLDKSIQRLGTKTRLAFDDWVNSIEKGTEDSDILTVNLEAQVKFSKELVDNFADVPSDQKVCYAEHLESAD